MKAKTFLERAYFLYIGIVVKGHRATIPDHRKEYIFMK